MRALTIAILSLGLLSAPMIGCSDNDAQPAPSHQPDTNTGEADASPDSDAADAGASDASDDAEPDVPVEPAALRVEPAQLFFENVEIGDTQTASLSLKNVGGEPLYINDANIAHFRTSTSEEFSFGEGAPDDGSVEVAPGTHAELEVEYAPVDRLGDRGQVTVYSTDPDNPQVVVPIDTVNAYAEIDAPSLLRFGAVDVGEQVTEEVAVYNRGFEQLIIEAITTDGDDAFTATMPAGTTPIIERDQAYVFEVTYEPTTEQPASATVTIETHADQRDFTMGVVGNEPTPCLRFSPHQVDFGEVGVGDDASETLIVLNCSTSLDLEIDDLVLEQDGGGVFELASAPDMPLKLAPTTTHEIVLTASNDQPRQATGAVTLSSDDPEQESVSIEVRAEITE